MYGLNILRFVKVVYLRLENVFEKKNPTYYNKVAYMNICKQNCRVKSLRSGKGKRDRLWIRFPLEGMKYFIISFLHSGVEPKYVVKFCHSTRNDLRIRRKLESVYLPLPNLL